MELEETLWRSHLEEAGHSLIAEGAELLLEERFEEALIALDGALELAPSLRPCAVCVPIHHSSIHHSTEVLAMGRSASCHLKL